MNTSWDITAAVRSITSGSLDGTGAGDHDAPYRFGRRPRASAPYPFSTRQYARRQQRERHDRAQAGYETECGTARQIHWESRGPLLVIRGRRILEPHVGQGGRPEQRAVERAAQTSRSRFQQDTSLFTS